MKIKFKRKSRLLETALKYTDMALSVLPLHTPIDGKCSCGDDNCSRIGKHPRTPHGVKDATIDKTVIKKWWKQWGSTTTGHITALRSSPPGIT